MENGSSKNRETNARKVSQRTSKVWDKFELMDVDGEEKAVCKQCGYELRGDSKAGTNHLWRHINKTKDDVISEHDDTPCKGNKRRAKQKMDNVTTKRARVNNNKQPKKPSDSVGLVPNEHLIIGSISESGADICTETLPLTAQKKQQEEFLIKKFEDAYHKEKEARVAAEKKVGVLTNKLNVFRNEKRGWEDIAKRLKEKVPGILKITQAMKENDSLVIVQDLQNEINMLLQQLENKKSLKPRVLVILWTRLLIQGRRFERNNSGINCDNDSGIDWDEHYLTFPAESRPTPMISDTIMIFDCFGTR